LLIDLFLVSSGLFVLHKRMRRQVSLPPQR
jgi:hypothetical protein